MSKNSPVKLAYHINLLSLWICKPSAGKKGWIKPWQICLGPLHLCWFLAHGQFNMRLISSWEENECCYKLSKCTSYYIEDYRIFSKVQIWVGEFFKFCGTLRKPQLYAFIIFFEITTLCQLCIVLIEIPRRRSYVKSLLVEDSNRTREGCHPTPHFIVCPIWQDKVDIVYLAY